MCLFNSSNAPIPIQPTTVLHPSNKMALPSKITDHRPKNLIGLDFQADHLDITMIDDDSDEKQEKAIITKSDALDVFA